MFFVDSKSFNHPVVVLSAKLSEQTVVPPLRSYDAQAKIIFLYYAAAHFEAAVPLNASVISFPRVDPLVFGLRSSFPAVESWLTFFESRQDHFINLSQSCTVLASLLQLNLHQICALTEHLIRANHVSLGPQKDFKMRPSDILTINL